MQTAGYFDASGTYHTDDDPSIGWRNYVQSGPQHPVADDGGVAYGGASASTADAPSLPGDGGSFSPGTRDAPIGVFPSTFTPAPPNPTPVPLIGADRTGIVSVSSPPVLDPVVGPDYTGSPGTVPTSAPAGSGSASGDTSSPSDNTRLMDLLSSIFQPQSVTTPASSYLYTPMANDNAAASDSKGRNLALLIFFLVLVGGAIYWYRRSKKTKPAPVAE